MKGKRHGVFERLKSIITGEAPPPSAQGEDEKTRRLQIATAVILLEVALSDDEFSDAERELIVSILKKRFSLDDEAVRDLLHVSEEQRVKSIDLYHFTEIINSRYDVEDKNRIIEMVWQVIYADGRLDKYEDHIVHKLARILHISHERMIEAKLKFLPDNR